MAKHTAHTYTDYAVRKQRFTLAGVWQFFLDRRKELRANGVSKPESDQIAEAEAEFKVSELVASGALVDPGGQVTAGKPNFERIEADIFEGKKSDLVNDFDWVAQNVAVADIGPEDAPSSFAWGLLTWVNENYKNRDEFFRTVVKRGASVQGKAPAEESPHNDDCREQFTALDAFNAELERGNSSGVPPLRESA